MNPIKLQKKRQRKETKRNLKRKAIRIHLNKLNGLGPVRKQNSINNAKRTFTINSAVAYLDAIIKKWEDKISPELIEKVNSQKIVLKLAMKSKNVEAIQKALTDFAPLDEEVLKIVKEQENPTLPNGV